MDRPCTSREEHEWMVGELRRRLTGTLRHGARQRQHDRRWIRHDIRAIRAHEHAAEIAPGTVAYRAGGMYTHDGMRF